MDVGEWLRSLGLEQYEAAFRDNAINEKVLPRLTAEDLKDLGVVIVGHRRTLLDAVATLRADANAKAAPADAVTATDTSPRDTAERRQVTVMFSDLVGSTALSARMDPEDLREVISAYQKCVAETVQRFGGFVAKYMGDGVLVYFGYPQAHEDDAERAVRAGLELVAAVAALKTRAPLQTRVGIATGLVVVGDLIGSGEAQERGIVGETPNLAARLQGVAEPNTVVIAEGTRKLLGNLFELEDLGAQGPQGHGRTGAGLGGAAGEFGGKPFRGAARQRPDGTGRAGGRTRIAAAALVESKDRRRPGRVAFRRGRYRQIAAHGGAAGTPRRRAAHALALFLLAAAHRQRALSDHQPDGTCRWTGARRHAASEARQARCRARADLDLYTGRGAVCRDAVAAERRPLSHGSNCRRSSAGRRTMEALSSQMEALSRQTPVLMIFEDAHWTDPTSLEAFGRTVDRIASLRVLLIVTFRPSSRRPGSAGRM